MSRFGSIELIEASNAALAGVPPEMFVRLPLSKLGVLTNGGTFTCEKIKLPSDLVVVGSEATTNRSLVVMKRSVGEADARSNLVCSMVEATGRPRWDERELRITDTYTASFFVTEFPPSRL
jgi:hypothetical protein